MKDPTPININGYDTYFFDVNDKGENYLLIAIPPNADFSFSDICGTFVNGHLIKEVGYAKVDGKVALMKAYY